jgi:tetratricopeptide (TPR) repeat protein
LAETYALFPSYSVAPAKDSMPQTKASALRALELDGSLAEPHTALAQYLDLMEWDRLGSIREYRRATELNPNYATAHQWLGTQLASSKQFDEAFVELKRAEELDPLSPIIGTNVGDTLVEVRRYDEAIAQYKRVLSFDPNFIWAHANLGFAFYLKGMYREASAEYHKALDLGDDPTVRGYLGLVLAKSGQRDEALKLLDGLKQESSQHFVPSYAFVLVYLGLDRKEEAFAWLEKDVAEHGSYASYYAVAPELDELRAEPRFAGLLKRLNLPE